MIFTKPKKIVIVDDDSMFCEALKDYITRKINHDVKVYATGEDCLQQLSSETEFLILDFHLNTHVKDAANGLEILQVIKKNFPKIHVIMLSSQERYTLAMQTIQKGAEQYIIKGENAFEEIAAILNNA